MLAFEGFDLANSYFILMLVFEQVSLEMHEVGSSFLLMAWGWGDVMFGCGIAERKGRMNCEIHGEKQKPESL